MNADQVKQLTQDIVSGLETVEDIAAGIDPALKPFVIIGKAIENQAPGIAATITAWIQGNPPTDADKASLNDQLKALESTSSI
jgi:hypothetical protein